MKESFQAALAALGLAIIFIYLILASQFASFTQPIAIMASLPFSLMVSSWHCFLPARRSTYFRLSGSSC